VRIESEMPVRGGAGGNNDIHPCLNRRARNLAISGGYGNEWNFALRGLADQVLEADSLFVQVQRGAQ